MNRKIKDRGRKGGGKILCELGKPQFNPRGRIPPGVGVLTWKETKGARTRPTLEGGVNEARIQA